MTHHMAPAPEGGRASMGTGGAPYHMAMECDEQESPVLVGTMADGEEALLQEPDTEEELHPPSFPSLAAPPRDEEESCMSLEEWFARHQKLATSRGAEVRAWLKKIAIKISQWEVVYTIAYPAQRGRQASVLSLL